MNEGELKKENAKLKEENSRLKNENHNLKEQIENYIPRRRVRRVFKQLKKILEQDGITDDLIDEDNCLRCGSGKPVYCEDCYQELISANAKLQTIPECTDKEWQSCGVEKMGCEGCHYNKEKKNDIK